MKTNYFSVILLLLAMIFNTSAEAKIWRVNNQSNLIKAPSGSGNCAHCFRELSDALGDFNVTANDTIYVEASPVNYAAVTMPNFRVVIIGPGYFLQQNPGLQFNSTEAVIQNINFPAGSAGSVIQGVTVAQDIDVYASNVVIARCYIRGGIGFHNPNQVTLSNINIRQCYIEYGIDGQNTGPVTQLSVSNCFMRSTMGLTNVKFSSTYQGIFTQNVVRGNVEGYNGMQYSNNIFVTNTMIQNNNSVQNVRYNTFPVAVSWLAETGNTNLTTVNMNSVFPSPLVFNSDANLELLESCSCNGEPGPQGQVNLKGVFGGTTPYVRGGIPNIPTIYNLSATGQVSTGQQTPVTISSRSNNNN